MRRHPLAFITLLDLALIVFKSRPRYHIKGPEVAYFRALSVSGEIAKEAVSVISPRICAGGESAKCEAGKTAGIHLADGELAS